MRVATINHKFCNFVMSQNRGIFPEYIYEENLHWLVQSACFTRIKPGEIHIQNRIFPEKDEI